MSVICEPSGVCKCAVKVDRTKLSFYRWNQNCWQRESENLLELRFERRTRLNNITNGQLISSAFKCAHISKTIRQILLGARLWEASFLQLLLQVYHTIFRNMIDKLNPFKILYFVSLPKAGQQLVPNHGVFRWHFCTFISQQ